jgi:hypothetical protein
MAAVAYVDTSWLLGIAFGEPDADQLIRRLRSFDTVVAGNLVEAEFHAAHRREGLDPNAVLLSGVSWVLPDRRLHAEIQRVLEAGYARGADCWHLAIALYVAGDPASITFLTLDQPQARVAAALGFKTPVRR